MATSAAPPVPGTVPAPSPRLYSPDLAPTQVTGRRWGGYNIFTLWASDVHSLGNYGFVLGLFALGLGNFWGILVTTLLFGVVAVVLAGGQLRIDGTLIESPADVVNTIPNTPLLLGASTALLVLTVAVNLMANFVAPCYALTNLFPKRLNFRSAGIISAVIGLVILPWNLDDNPAVIVYFLGVLGALLGPLSGIVVADYWVLRRARVDVPALYTGDPAGAYHFRGGVNPRAVAAFVPSAAVAVDPTGH